MYYIPPPPYLGFIMFKDRRIAFIFSSWPWSGLMVPYIDRRCLSSLCGWGLGDCLLLSRSSLRGFRGPSTVIFGRPIRGGWVKLPFLSAGGGRGRLVGGWRTELPLSSADGGKFSIRVTRLGTRPWHRLSSISPEIRRPWAWKASDWELMVSINWMFESADARFMARSTANWDVSWGSSPSITLVQLSTAWVSDVTCPARLSTTRCMDKLWDDWQSTKLCLWHASCPMLALVSRSWPNMGLESLSIEDLEFALMVVEKAPETASTVSRMDLEIRVSISVWLKLFGTGVDTAVDTWLVDRFKSASSSW